MNLKEVLDKFFKVYNKQIEMKEIIKKFEIKEDMISTLEQVLYELEKEGKIYCDENNFYMHVPEEFYLYHGIIKLSNANQEYISINNKERIIIKKKNLNGAKKGDIVFVQKNNKNIKHPKNFEGTVVKIVEKKYYSHEDVFIIKDTLKKDGNIYYVKHNENRIYISSENINTSYVGDLVNVQLMSSSTGKVIEIIKRNSDEHVFKYVKENNKLKWFPIGSSHQEFYLNNNNFNEGDLIIAKIHGNDLEFVKKIEHKNILNTQIQTLIIDYGFNIEFSNKIIDEMNNIPLKITDDEIKKRVDLRNLETFTIDPAYAKDLDDAVSLEYVNGIYRLYVHTADPSHYIKLDSEIFKESLKRCFSIYPSEYVIPMLHETISNKVCSLNQDGDKLSITCRLDINSDGKVIDFEVFKSIIKNNKKMSYDKVNDILENREIDEEYIPYIPSLLKMNELSCILQKVKLDRGFIFVESQENKISVDDMGHPIGLIEKQKGPAQLMIENFMIIANENISLFAYYLNLPFIYRNHEQPTISKKNKLINNLSEKGYYFQKIGNISSPKVLQQFIKTIFKGKNNDEIKYLSQIILPSFSRAYYDYKNMGHFGLALDCYGTFTSPIRKVSDLLNHMVITEFLENGILNDKLGDIEKIINESCEYISEKQRSIDFLEQEVDNLLLNEYVYQFINQEFDATILFINKEGIYVKLSNGLSGIIYTDKRYKILNNCVVDPNSGKIYKVGNHIKVILKEVDKNNIIFELSKILNDEKTFVKRRD